MHKTVSGIMLVLLLVGMLTLAFNIRPVNAWTGTVYIRADGSIDPPDAPIVTFDNVTYTLTDNITSSNDGIVVERDNILIDGAGYTVQGPAPYVPSCKGINLSGRKNITIKNIEITVFDFGIHLYYSVNCDIYWNNISANNLIGIVFQYSSNNSVKANNITSNYYGIKLAESCNNQISGNKIANNGNSMSLSSSSNNSVIRNNITNNLYGISLQSSSNNNIIGKNVISVNNIYGIAIVSSTNNKVHHNNFVNNIPSQVYVYDSTNSWDNGYPSGGNYWSDYSGVDADGDGIGDIPYVIDADNQDRYPLMKLWTLMPTVYTFSIVWGEETFTVSVESNSTLSNFAFNQPNKEISFYVTGPDGTIGFCNVTIPKALLWIETPDEWILLIDGSLPIFLAITENATHNSLYFAYTHSTHEVRIIGTHAIAPPPPPLSVSISPLSASIMVGQSVIFTSTVSGGYTPYSYQWCLNGNPVSGATSNTWSFTPTTSGIYYVYLKITDSKSNMVQSDTARTTVTTVPVGGYSIPIKVHTKTEPIIPYIALTAILTAIFVNVKRKTERKR